MRGQGWRGQRDGEREGTEQWGEQGDRESERTGMEGTEGRGQGQGASHHVDLEKQQLQPIAPAQVPQAVMDVAGVEVVVPQAGEGTHTKGTG